MNKKLLRQLQARHEQRLSDLKGQIESGEVREADLDSINEEIDGLIDELKGIKEELDEVSTDEEPSDENNDSVVAATDTDGEGRSTEVEEENRSGMISQEQRDGLLGSIRNGMQARNTLSKEKREKEIRKAFANFVVGNITEQEARSLGIEAGNGSVTVPEVIASEVITYAQ